MNRHLKTAETINIIHRKYIYYQEKEKLNALLFLKINNDIIFYFYVKKYYKQQKENRAAGAAIINKRKRPPFNAGEISARPINEG